MRIRPVVAVLAAAVLSLGWLSAAARGDGGTVRLSERVGGYQVAVFTAPTPFQAGPVDISVLVQDAATGDPLPDARVTVRLTPAGRAGEPICCPATTRAATNKLFRAAVLDLPAAGRWQADVDIDGARGPARARFELDAADPPPRGTDMWPWIGLPVLPILLFSIHQVLVRRTPHAGRPGW